MHTNSTIINILARWPSRRALADDMGVDLYAVHRWFQRQALPGKYDAALIAAARRRGIRLKTKELIEARALHTDQHGHTLFTNQGLTK